MFKPLFTLLSIALPFLTQLLIQQLTEQALGPAIDPDGKT